ncbi:MAG: TRAP transporter large permease subunit, partial [Spirochaetales bacterium]
SSWIKKDTRMTWNKIVASCTDGAKSAVSVGVPCLLIGIIIATVTLTSLGLNIGYMITNGLASGSLFLVGLLVMVISVVLGMGVPGVAAYVIVQAVAVPVLLKAGAIPLAAHMFCLIYACLSNITPPVAISCFVAAGIADADQTKTGLLSVRLALIGFIIPMFFLSNPVLLPLAQSSSVYMTLTATASAAIGTVLLSSALEGYFLTKQNWIERLLFAAASLLLLYPGSVTDLCGLVLAAALIVFQIQTRRNKQKNNVM